MKHRSFCAVVIALGTIGMLAGCAPGGDELAARSLSVPVWETDNPFLPLPTVGYVRLRAVTQYGDAAAVPTGDDVARYLVWCREMRRDGSR